MQTENAAEEQEQDAPYQPPKLCRAKGIPPITDPTVLRNIEYLSEFVNRYIRISIADARVFVGQLRCLDRVWSRTFLGRKYPKTNVPQDLNIILALTYEFRPPTASDHERAAAQANAIGLQAPRVETPKRYVGLVVIPGKHITKIEYEE